MVNTQEQVLQQIPIIESSSAPGLPGIRHSPPLTTVAPKLISRTRLTKSTATTTTIDSVQDMVGAPYLQRIRKGPRGGSQESLRSSPTGRKRQRRMARARRFAGTNSGAASAAAAARDANIISEGVPVPTFVGLLNQQLDLGGTTIVSRGGYS